MVNFWSQKQAASKQKPHRLLGTRLPSSYVLSLSIYIYIGNKNNICFNFNGSAYWGRKAKKKCFTKHSLKVAINHLITNCYFSVGNIVMRQKIGIPMGIDPAPFWANLFLYSYEHDYIKKRIKEDRVHKLNTFIPHLCSLMIFVL